ncbi:cyclin-like protein [Thelephora ganbajun]|uniref:Cyclin-like protein n=1 Tax=Thelephora ganbajun TaxID=370292 RepID=A0ACB6ZLA4_THEGA|nr:cyclin-like protein [Thelephora ganbajun]
MSESATTVEPSRKKPLYEGSTQFRNWRFSKEQLSRKRSVLNVAAVEAVKRVIENDSPGSSKGVLFLNADEELLLVRHYLTKVVQLCDHFHFPEEVEATATTYIKRFYLTNTVMDWHPKNVMLTALFLATKTTNNPISLDSYAAHIPRTEPGDVLELEFLVAQSLGFDFAVWHPHRALWGAWLDLQSATQLPPSELDQVYNQAMGHVRASRLTDAEFIYSPAQIAVACISLASPQVANTWARSKGTNESFIPSLCAMIQEGSKLPGVEMIREVDRRLKLCKNPEKVAGSSAYLAKKAEEERLAVEKRTKKADEIRNTGGEDPFGSELGTTLDDDDD